MIAVLHSGMSWNTVLNIENSIAKLAFPIHGILGNVYPTKLRESGRWGVLPLSPPILEVYPVRSTTLLSPSVFGCLPVGSTLLVSTPPVSAPSADPQLLDNPWGVLPQRVLPL